MSGVTPRPARKTWNNAKELHRVYLRNESTGGTWPQPSYLGCRWVQVGSPLALLHHLRHRMRRTEWDKLPAGDRQPMGKDN